MGEEEIILIYAFGCFLFAQLSRVGVHIVCFICLVSFLHPRCVLAFGFQEMADVMKSEHTLRNLGIGMVDWVVLLVNYVPFQ
jgi:hypothetical protein